MRTFLYFLLPCFFLLLSCKKTDIYFDEIVSNDAIELRSEIQKRDMLKQLQIL